MTDGKHYPSDILPEGSRKNISRLESPTWVVAQLHFTVPIGIVIAAVLPRRNVKFSICLGIIFLTHLMWISMAV